MEKEVLEKIKAQDKKLEEIYFSIERMRKYFLCTLVYNNSCDCYTSYWVGVYDS